MSLIVTMSLFADGVAPKDLPPSAPYSWFLEEEYATTFGNYWGRFRTRSIEYTKAFPEEFAAFQSWNTIDNGAYRMLKTPDIPITDETYGVIHGDAHTGNYFFENLGTSEERLVSIDLDRAQKSWFLNDLGAVVWHANMGMLVHFPDEREQMIADFKEWILAAYEWPTTAEELTEACNFRRQQMERLVAYGLTVDVGSFWWKFDVAYTYWNITGKIPNC